MKYSYDRSFTFKLNDDEWTFFILTTEEGIELYNDTMDDESDEFEALIIYDSKCIFLCESVLDTNKTVAHELFHLMVHYLHLSSADLDVDQFEEVIAVWLENNIDKFIRIRDEIYNKFKQLENSGKK